MCLATIGLVAGLAGTAVSAVGQIAAGRQQQALANAQARALDQQAEAERRAAGFEMMKESRQHELTRSAARAQVGASGVGFQGSPTAVLTANAGQNQLDLDAIRFNSVIRQNNLHTQGQISRVQGRAARTNSIFAAAGNAFSGVSGIAGQYQKSRYQNAVMMNSVPLEFQ